MEISYEQAVRNIADYIDQAGGPSVHKGFSVFDGSTALAIVFDTCKEKTLRDIMNYRASKVKLCPRSATPAARERDAGATHRTGTTARQ